MIIKIPYRINWAGAYLDCIDEPVITSTVDKYITAESSKRDDNLITVFSYEFNERYETEISPRLLREYKWTDYIDGCIAVFIRNDFNLKTGCDIIVKNDLPSGIGVSSSAAFIIAIIKTLCYHNNIDIDDNLICHFAYWVEHDYLKIPCGTMDFKAVLHTPGIWKIDTSTTSLTRDRQLSNKQYDGLLIYKNEKHEHLTDEQFMNNVINIRNAKFNYKYDNSATNYISFEEQIVNCFNYFAKEDKLDETHLGMLLNQSTLNLRTNLLNTPKTEWKYLGLEGLYGEKLVGSGLKGGEFLLVNPAYLEEIKEYLCNNNWNVIVCKL